MKKRITGWSIIKVFLTLTLVIFCLGIWPGYLIHTYQTMDLYPPNITHTQWISAGDVVRQYFLPANSRLFKIEIALEFDKSMVANESLYFTLWDDTGTIICRREIYFNQIDAGHFFDVVVDVKLNPKHEYMWTLTMPESTELQYAVLCANDISDYIIENRALMINDEDTQKSAVNWYEYYKHIDKSAIIGGFWTGAVLSWLLLLELIDRAERFFERKNNDKKNRNAKEI